MNNVLCSIKDVRSGWGPCYPMKTKGEAERHFQNLVSSEKSGNMYSHSEDFDLFAVGEFDLTTGEILNYDQKEKIISGLQARELAPNK